MNWMELKEATAAMHWYDWAAAACVVLVVLILMGIIRASFVKDHESCLPLVSMRDTCDGCGRPMTAVYMGLCIECILEKISTLEICAECGRAWEPESQGCGDRCPSCRIREVVTAIPLESFDPDSQSIGCVKGSCVRQSSSERLD